jgi:uncharacterized protein YciI
MFTTSFIKSAQQDDGSWGPTATKGAAIGAGIGAAKNIAHELYLNHRERKVSNTRGHKDFLKKLKRGDLLVAGSTPAHSGAVTLGDLPKPIANLGKKFGMKGSKKVLTNSTMLTSIGGGGKYHGLIYLGKGKVGHMTSDEGAAIEPLSLAAEKQNLAAYRLKKGKGHGQASRAAKFAESSKKKKVQYQSTLETMKEPLSNIAIPKPFGEKACRNTKKGMVCHTLPAMAYDKQKFSQGRRTYSGDLRRNMNFEPVARKETIKIPMSVKTRGMLGQASKGLKYALPAAALATAAKYLKNKKQEDK